MLNNVLLILLQCALMAMAAPMDGSVSIESNAWQAGTGGGVLGFIVFIIDVIFIGE